MTKIRRARTLSCIITYGVALIGVFLCLQITLPLPDRDLRIDRPVLTVDKMAGAPGRHRAAGDSSEFDFGAEHARYWFQASPNSERLAALIEFTAPTGVLSINGSAIQTVYGPRTMVSPSSIYAMVTIPAWAMKPGTNSLDVALSKIGARDRTIVWRVYVGPEDKIAASYAKLAILTQFVPALNFGWRLLLSAMLFGIFLARRQEVSSMLLSLALICGAPALLRSTGASQMLPDPISAYIGLGAYWQLAFVAVFAYWCYARRLDWVAWLFLSGAALVCSLIVLAPLSPWVIKSGPIFGVVCVVSGALFFGLLARRTGELEDHIMFCNMLVLSIVSLVEIPSLLKLEASVQLFRVNMTALLIFIVISALLIARFIASLNAVDRFNVQLAAELSGARSDLRQALEREHAASQVAALQRERERLMRDLHDGVSGRIVATIALCELKGGDYLEIGETLRGVLQELRLVIASLADPGGDLQQVFFTFRDQTDLQLRRLGIRLRCHVPDLPKIKNWMPGHSLHVYRILQECVANAAKHSGCKDIDLCVSLPPGASGTLVRIRLSDTGCGGASERAGGYGLQNMRRRAAALGGELEIFSDHDGTTVQLDIPIEVAEPLRPGASFMAMKPDSGLSGARLATTA